MYNSKNGDLSRLLNYEEAAEVLGIKLGTLRTWVSYKKIPYIKINGAVRFSQSMLMDFIDFSSHDTKQ